MQGWTAKKKIKINLQKYLLVIQEIHTFDLSFTKKKKRRPP